MSTEYNTDVSGYVKKNDAVLASDVDAKLAYKKQKKLLNSIAQNSKDIEELRHIINNLMKRIEILENGHS